jgi:hypothetical protein
MIWNFIAWVLSRPFVLPWLLAFTTPYRHIKGADGSIYMYRYWLFNRCDSPRHVKRWPSIRLHHIVRPDMDRHPHDHPWTWARTFVLRNWYAEEVPYNAVPPFVTATVTRKAGYTGVLRHGSYHRIAEVAEGGVWTLFVTGPKVDSWGFLVDGRRVEYRDYLGEDVGNYGMFIGYFPDGTWCAWDDLSPMEQRHMQCHQILRYNFSTDEVIKSEPVT